MKNDLHLVCPHCQSINRVPANKFAEKSQLRAVPAPAVHRMLALMEN